MAGTDACFLRVFPKATPGSVPGLPGCLHFGEFFGVYSFLPSYRNEFESLSRAVGRQTAGQHPTPDYPTPNFGRNPSGTKPTKF